MKSRDKYSMEESAFLIAVVNSLEGYDNKTFEKGFHISNPKWPKLRRQVRSVYGRSDACIHLLNCLSKLNDKEKFYYSVAYYDFDRKDVVFCSISKTRSKLNSYIHK